MVYRPRRGEIQTSVEIVKVRGYIFNSLYHNMIGVAVTLKSFRIMLI